jgi:hypothetical protein
MPRKKKDEKPVNIPKVAQTQADNLIAYFGIERAEVIAKLIYQKCRASAKRLEEKYGGK